MVSRKSPTILKRRDLRKCRLVADLINAGSISTEDICQHRYQDISASSFHKTFKRDRDELEAEGVHLLESKHGLSKTWTLDQGRTVADVSCLGDDARDRALLVRSVGIMLRPLVGDVEIGGPQLGQAIARMALDTCAGPRQPQVSPCPCKPEVLHAVSEGLSTRRPVRLLYRSLSDATPTVRIVRAWGTFQLNNTVYLVCERSREGTEEAVRTYNLSRAQDATVCADEPPYAIPDDFSVSNYVLLPFEIGDSRVQVSLYVPRAQTSAFERVVRRRGSIERRRGGSLVWNGLAANVQRAASWAVEAGAIPLEPRELVEAWERLLEPAANETNAGLEDGGDAR